jgi:hypothetical protein
MHAFLRQSWPFLACFTDLDALDPESRLQGAEKQWKRIETNP